MSTQMGGTFRRQVEVFHPSLRTLMGLKAGEEVHHDVQVGGGGGGRGESGCNARNKLLSACLAGW